MNRIFWQLFFNDGLDKRVLECERKDDLCFPAEVEYDVIIMNLYKIELKEKDIDVLVKQASNLLNSKGKLCISFNNKYCYRKLFARSSENGSRKEHTLHKIVALCRQFGFKEFDVYSLYPEAEHIREIRKKYTDIHKEKNKVFTFLKELILNSFIMKHYQLAYGIIAYKKERDSGIFLRHIEKHIGVKVIQRLIIGKPSSLVLLENNKVFRLPLDRISKVRSRINANILKSLAKTSIDTSVPRILGIEHIQGQRCYVESRISGIAIDSPQSDLKKLTAETARIITDFHHQTAKQIVIDKKQFHCLFSRDMMRLKEFCTFEDQNKVDVIQNQLVRKLLGSKFVTVWVHGDLKIENILINRKTRQITGAIDWDLSQRQGLPLLDVLYLLIYTRGILTKENTLRIYLEQFLPGRTELWEQRIIDNYIEAIGLPLHLVKPLTVMFWFNNMARRNKQQLLARTEWFNKEIHCGIDVLFQFLVNDKLTCKN